MELTFISVITLSLYAIYFMLPAYLANVSALAFGGGRPVDFKRNWRDGTRILGDGKTWRGFIVGIFVGTLVGIVLGVTSIYVIQAFNTYYPLDSYYYAILPVNIFQGALLGFFMGLGAMVGDSCGSFVKRRIKLPRGSPAPFLDQLDFVVGALVFASLIVIIPWDMVVLIFILSIFLHLGANIIAYLLGMKNVWY